MGVKINEVGKPGSAGLVRSINGRPNASVLPDPVGARQHKSLPNIPSGIDSVCTSNGWSIP